MNVIWLIIDESDMFLLFSAAEAYKIDNYSFCQYTLGYSEYITNLNQACVFFEARLHYANNDTQYRLE